jgi:hypothetical protein
VQCDVATCQFMGKTWGTLQQHVLHSSNCRWALRHDGHEGTLGLKPCWALRHAGYQGMLGIKACSAWGAACTHLEADQQPLLHTAKLLRPVCEVLCELCNHLPRLKVLVHQLKEVLRSSSSSMGAVGE